MRSLRIGSHNCKKEKKYQKKGEKNMLTAAGIEPAPLSGPVFPGQQQQQQQRQSNNYSGRISQMVLI